MIQKVIKGLWGKRKQNQEQEKFISCGQVG